MVVVFLVKIVNINLVSPYQLFDAQIDGKQMLDRKPVPLPLLKGACTNTL